MIEHKIDNTEGILNTFIITFVHDLYIERCLKTLTTTIDRKKHRIILIEAPSVEKREIIYPKIKDYLDIYIRTEKNYGFSQSVNIGMSLVRTPYFTIVHDDCWFIHKGWWEEIAEVLTKDQNLLMLQPVQANRRGKMWPEFPSEEEYKQILSYQKSTSVAEIYCMIFKKQWLDEIGFLDESIYPIGPEDLEFWRLALAVNKRTGVTNKAMVFHKGAGRQDRCGGGLLHEYIGERNDFMDKWQGDKNLAVGGLTHGYSIQPQKPNILRQL